MYTYNYTCPSHYQIVQGFCLSYECTNTEFCINCLIDGTHAICKRNCKQFDEIKEFIDQSFRFMTELEEDVKKTYESINEQFVKIDKILIGQKQQLLRLQEYLIAKNYASTKENIQILKDWHDYFKNTDFDSIKNNNSTRNELFKVQRFIDAMRQSQDQFLAKKFPSIRQSVQFDVDGKIIQGLELAMNKQWKEACSAFEAVLQYDPEHCENLFYYSIAKTEINELQNSYLMIQKLESINPRFYSEKLNRLKQFKDFALSRVLIGITLTKQKFNYAAKEQFINAIYKEPSLACAYNYYCELLQQSQNFSEAEEQIKQALKDHPEYAIALYNQGVTLIENQIYKQAITAFEKVLSFDSEFANGYYQKGVCLQNLKRPKEASQAYTKAQKYCDPNDVYLSSLIKTQMQNLQRYN